MLGFDPYLAGGIALAIIAAAAGGFLKGEDYANAKHDQAGLKQLTVAVQHRDEKQGQINTADAVGAQREVVRQTEVREVTREIPTIIEKDRVVFQRVCIDADGVRLLDRAAAAASGDNDSGAPTDQAGGPAEGPAHN